MMLVPGKLKYFHSGMGRRYSEVRKGEHLQQSIFHWLLGKKYLERIKRRYFHKGNDFITYNFRGYYLNSLAEDKIELN